MTLQQIFIANLKIFRKKRGISQMILAEMCDTTANYIGQIEMGRRIPSFEKIEKIAAALEIDSHQLFMREGGKQPAGPEPTTKDFLRKLPVRVKREIIAQMQAAINKDVTASFDPRHY
jgi:transcriptional regulator with XRE-family HTH domain